MPSIPSIHSSHAQTKSHEITKLYFTENNLTAVDLNTSFNLMLSPSLSPTLTPITTNQNNSQPICLLHKTNPVFVYTSLLNCLESNRVWFPGCIPWGCTRRWPSSGRGSGGKSRGKRGTGGSARSRQRAGSASLGRHVEVRATASAVWSTDRSRTARGRRS